MRSMALLGCVLVAAGGAAGAAGCDAGEDGPDDDLTDAAAPPSVDAQLADASCVPAFTIFLNRGGGTYFPANADDASANYSSIISATVVLGPATFTDQQWSMLRACVADKLAPFSVAVTDVDPGAAPHKEIVVTGDGPEAAGLPNEVGGVAPFHCGGTPHAIQFLFQAGSTDVRYWCQTALSQLGHTFGLDDVTYAPDLMYVVPSDVTLQQFTDYDAPCSSGGGDCFCGGTTQNSYQTLLAMLGPACP